MQSSSGNLNISITANLGQFNSGMQQAASYIQNINTSASGLASVLARVTGAFNQAQQATQASTQGIQQTSTAAMQAGQTLNMAGQATVNFGTTWQTTAQQAQQGGAQTAAAATAAAAGTTAAGNNINQNMAQMNRWFGINRMGALEMQAAVVNSFQAVASGMDVGRVAMMESTQVLGALVQGGVIGFGWLNAATGTAAVGALALGAATAYYAYQQYQAYASVRDTSVGLLMLGRGMDYTKEQLNSSIGQFRSKFGDSYGSIRDTTQYVDKLGDAFVPIRGEVMGLVKSFAALRNESLSAGTESFEKQFGTSTESWLKAAEAQKAVTPVQAEHIQQLIKQNKEEEAAVQIKDALNKRWGEEGQKVAVARNELVQYMSALTSLGEGGMMAPVGAGQLFMPGQGELKYPDQKSLTPDYTAGNRIGRIQELSEAAMVRMTPEIAKQGNLQGELNSLKARELQIIQEMSHIEDASGDDAQDKVKLSQELTRNMQAQRNAAVDLAQNKGVSEQEDYKKRQLGYEEEIKASQQNLPRVVEILQRRAQYERQFWGERSAQAVQSENQVTDAVRAATDQHMDIELAGMQRRQTAARNDVQERLRIQREEILPRMQSAGIPERQPQVWQKALEETTTLEVQTQDELHRIRTLGFEEEVKAAESNQTKIADIRRRQAAEDAQYWHSYTSQGIASYNRSTDAARTAANQQFQIWQEQQRRQEIMAQNDLQTKLRLQQQNVTAMESRGMRETQPEKYESAVTGVTSTTIQAADQQFSIWQAQQQRLQQQAVSDLNEQLRIQREIVHAMEERGAPTLQPEKYESALSQLSQFANQIAQQNYQRFAQAEQLKLQEAGKDWARITQIYREWGAEAERIFGRTSQQFADVQFRMAQEAQRATDDVIREYGRQTDTLSRIDTAYLSIFHNRMDSQAKQHKMTTTEALGYEIEYTGQLYTQLAAQYDAVLQNENTKREVWEETYLKKLQLEADYASRITGLQDKITASSQRSAQQVSQAFQKGFDEIGSAFERVVVGAIDRSMTKTQAIDELRKAVIGGVTSTVFSIGSQFAGRGLAKMMGVELDPGKDTTISSVLSAKITDMLGLGAPKTDESLKASQANLSEVTKQSSNYTKLLTDAINNLSSKIGGASKIGEGSAVATGAGSTAAEIRGGAPGDTPSATWSGPGKHVNANVNGDAGQRSAAVLLNRGWSEASVEGALNNSITESSLNPNAKGAAGEKGLYQFHPDTHLPKFIQTYKGDMSPEAQTNYMADYVERTMPDYPKIQDSKVATTEFLRGFERPKRQGQDAVSERFLNQPASHEIVSSVKQGSTPSTAPTAPAAPLASATPVPLLTSPAPLAPAITSAPASAPQAQVTAVGDSIAAHLIRKGGAEGQEDRTAIRSYRPGDTAVSAYKPQEVLQVIKDLPDSSVRGKSVALSSGASNDPKQAELAEQQIQLLKEKGASDVTLLGVGSSDKLQGVNDRLEKIASQQGAAFTGPLRSVASDGIHSADNQDLLRQIAESRRFTASTPTVPTTLPDVPSYRGSFDNLQAPSMVPQGLSGDIQRDSMEIERSGGSIADALKSFASRLNPISSAQANEFPTTTSLTSSGSAASSTSNEINTDAVNNNTQAIQTLSSTVISNFSNTLHTGDPEAAGLANLSTTMEPATTQYVKDVAHGEYAKSGMQRYFGESNYDPSKTPGENALNPQALEQATDIALATGPGATSSKLLVPNKSFDMPVPTLYHGAARTWPAEPGAPLGKPNPLRLGSGEGYHGEGYGFYATESEPVSRWYNSLYGGKENFLGTPEGWLENVHPDLLEQIQSKYETKAVGLKKGSPELEALFPAIEQEYSQTAKRLGYDPTDLGSVYKMEIPNATQGQFLRWDLPLKEQSPYVKEMLQTGQKPIVKPDVFDSRITGNFTGADLYGGLSETMRHGGGLPQLGQNYGDPIVAQALSDKGILGTRYPSKDEFNPDSPFNYSIYDPSVLKVTGRSKTTERTRDKWEDYKATYDEEGNPSEYLWNIAKGHPDDVAELLNNWKLDGTLEKKARDAGWPGPPKMPSFPWETPAVGGLTAGGALTLGQSQAQAQTRAQDQTTLPSSTFNPLKLGDPEATAAVQASQAMEPVTGQYLKDVTQGEYVKSGMQHYFGADNYDPSKSLSENALNPEALQQATDIALSTGPGATGSSKLLVPNKSFDMPVPTLYHGAARTWGPEPDAPLGKPNPLRLMSGEGHHGEGYGFYASESEPVSRWYNSMYGGQDVKQTPGDWLETIHPDLHKEIEKEYKPKLMDAAAKGNNQYYEVYQQLQAEQTQTAKQLGYDQTDLGSVYRMEIPSATQGQFLRWDQDLSEQSPYVKEMLQTGPKPRVGSVPLREFRGMSGQDLYGTLSEAIREKRGLPQLENSFGDPLVSEALSRKGILGTRYPSADEITPGDPFNYSVYDPSILKVTGRSKTTPETKTQWQLYQEKYEDHGEPESFIYNKRMYDNSIGPGKKDIFGDIYNEVADLRASGQLHQKAREMGWEGPPKPPTSTWETPAVGGLATGGALTLGSGQSQAATSENRLAGEIPQLTSGIQTLSGETQRQTGVATSSIQELSQNKIAITDNVLATRTQQTSVESNTKESQTATTEVKDNTAAVKDSTQTLKDNKSAGGVPASGVADGSMASSSKAVNSELSTASQGLNLFSQAAGIASSAALLFGKNLSPTAKGIVGGIGLLSSLASFGVNAVKLGGMLSLGGGGVIPSAYGGMQLGGFSVQETSLAPSIKQGVRNLAESGQTSPFSSGRVTSTSPGSTAVNDGKGGRLVIAHPGEMILPREDTSFVLNSVGRAPLAPAAPATPSALLASSVPPTTSTMSSYSGNVIPSAAGGGIFGGVFGGVFQDMFGGAGSKGEPVPGSLSKHPGDADKFYFQALGGERPIPLYPPDVNPLNPLRGPASSSGPLQSPLGGDVISAESGAVIPSAKDGGGPGFFEKLFSSPLAIGGIGILGLGLGIPLAVGMDVPLGFTGLIGGSLLAAGAVGAFKSGGGSSSSGGDSTKGSLSVTNAQTGAVAFKSASTDTTIPLKAPIQSSSLGLVVPGTIPSAAGGLSVNDGKGGTLAIVHPRETVLPADLSIGLQGVINRESNINQTLQNMQNNSTDNSRSSSANAMTLNYSPNISGYHPYKSRSDMMNMLRSQGGTIMRWAESTMRNGQFPTR